MSGVQTQARREAVGAHPLDQAVWRALTGMQRDLALGDGRVVRYPSEVGRFAAMADASTESFEALRAFVIADGPLALVTTHALATPSDCKVIRDAILLQMIWQGTSVEKIDLPHIVLGQDDVPDMLALTAATEPGPFGPRTVELGRYIGIRSDEGRLVAMAGERMRLDGFTEISAVCVDPAFRGRGYAAGLMKLQIQSIRARGETPFLHVFTTNHGAIALYRALGFVDRREMQLTVFERA